MSRAESFSPFPLSRQLPLSPPDGPVTVNGESASTARPFGMRLARRCVALGAPIPEGYGVDPDTQTGIVRAGDTVHPLARHTDGRTSTVTDGGDGRVTNKDSDDDWRED